MKLFERPPISVEDLPKPPPISPPDRIVDANYVLARDAATPNILNQTEPLSEEQALDLLSYWDVLPAQELAEAVEDNRHSPNGLKYAATLVKMSQEDGLRDVIVAAYDIKASCIRELVRLKIVPTTLAHSLSWAFWDLAKQRYLFEHPEESNSNYSLGDPMGQDASAQKVREDILNRHIGWEFDVAMGGPEDLGHRNPDNGQLPSYVYAQIGARLRGE